MYRARLTKVSNTSIRVNDSVEGETIEQKMERVVNNGDAITDGAPIIYTDRKDGVLPDYDIRTDRFEVAIDAMDKVTKARLAKREEGQKSREEIVKDHNREQKGGGKEVEDQSTQGTE